MNRIRITEKHHADIYSHLFPGDGMEAVGIALCGKHFYKGNQTLLVQDFYPVPYDVCERTEDYIRWSTDFINPLLEKAQKENLSLLKIHCHPSGYDSFSDLDNESDYALFVSIHSWLQSNYPHSSCVMLPDGKLFGRFFHENMEEEIVHQFSIIGSDIKSWHYSDNELSIKSEAFKRNEQAFGKKTVKLLSKMKIAVVGCSGTGSPTIEQLTRLGVSTLVLVDNDYLDTVNLNRILGSNYTQALSKISKVDLLEAHVREIGLDTEVESFRSNLVNEDVIKAVADCDVIFGCVDSAEGRHIMDLLSAYYIIPLIDIGVKFDADGQGGIYGLFGSVHYVKPFGSSLMSRGQYNLEQIASEEIKRRNKEEFARNQYLVEAGESSPAVISINMQMSSIAVNELLARIHPYRTLSNAEIDVIRSNFSEAITFSDALPEPCPYLSKKVGKGSVHPLLNRLEFSVNEQVV